MARITEIYGELTFNKDVMKDKLNKDVYRKLLATIHKGEPVDEEIAGDVAHAMKEWAIENGATHFTHWFQPQRGGTAEKHDAFIAYGEDGDIIERFSASQLIQSEPDASSFPSGGIRATFEARGYTAWDPTSPAFLLEAGETKTLVIPSVYLSWTGDVLDLKTPFLRSKKSVAEAAIRLQKLLGNDKMKQVNVFAGPEQEYFLVAKELYETRPDLICCSRTLFGAPPARGQQMEDHYFGAINERVIVFMEDLDNELFRRGIPAKTRHNEVAPNQFEIAPLYEEANLAIDHNLQLMDIIQKVAARHDLVCLLHEKPLAGVNGSGKHFNFSIGDDTGANYFEPSNSPHNNIMFLMSLGALLLGVKKYGGLLRGVVASAGNDHRLGANEAPPAIMSVYLGTMLDDLLNEIEGMGVVTEKKLSHINVGVANLPKIVKDFSDRNRTSPIAFTGNKFEFRAVGSAQNCAKAGMMLNLIMAYGYSEVADRIEALKDKVDAKEKAVTVLEQIVKETKAVRFEGNGYDVAWHEEAAKRGLPNTKTTPEALEQFLNKDVENLFEKFGVLNKRELHSKIEIELEEYSKVKDIEFKIATDIARTLIMPAIVKQINMLATAVSAISGKASPLAEDVEMFSGLYGDIKKATEALEKATADCCGISDALERAKACAGKGADALAALRIAVDAAEVKVADELWPMAKYQELLTAL